MSDAETPILWNAENGVATLTFNRPHRHNAWTTEMEALLRALLSQATADPKVRVIVLRGAGRAFCAGFDLEGVGTEGLLTAPPYRAGDLEQRYSYVRGVPKPVIAAIDGAAIGVGLVLALVSDIRLASSRARFSTGFTRRGVIAEHGSAWLLTQIVGAGNAADLVLSGRTVEADEAATMGLARLLDRDFDAEVMNYAQDIAQNCAPRSLAIAKRQLACVGSQTLAQATRMADLELEACESTPELREGVASFFERRKPGFAPITGMPKMAGDTDS